VSQEIRWRVLKWTTEGDPDAGSEENFTPVKSKGTLQALRDPLRDSGCVSWSVNVLDQDGELVPAKARGGILGTQTSLQPIGDRYEQLIPFFVPQAIVRDFEVVQVHEQHRNLAASPIRTTQGVFEAIHEQRSVRQTAERIVKRLMAELLLQGLALGYVPGGDHHAPYSRVVEQVVYDVL
jgi:hypothetical protein